MITAESSGSFDNTETWLKKLASGAIFDSLSKYGQAGVDALAAATPVDDGTTAAAWYFEVVKDSKSWSIVWGNNNIVDGRPIAVLLQHGHGTGTGGYVEGRDYINPALKPIMDQMANEGWKAVISA